MERNDPTNPPCGVLLLAHGGPDSLQDIEPFLRNIRGGRGFSPKLLEEITDRYRQIGGSSPLLGISRSLAQALEKELRSQGGHFRVYLGMRNWHPFIRKTMEEIKQDGMSRLVALCLAPQNSRMSVGLYFRAVQEAQKELGVEIPVSYVESWHREPLLIAAFAEKLREAIALFPPLRNGRLPVIFTAHSLPEKIIGEGDPYDPQVRDTARAVAECCNLADWRFAYQSQGMTSEPWLGPTVESVIEELAASGFRQAIVAPIGFLADHLEILYDIDIHYRQYASERGIELRRPQSLNDSPALAKALAAVVAKAVRAATVMERDPS
jgi:ferrochelatase